MRSTGVEPDLFDQAVASLRALRPRSEIQLEEVPAPQRLAPRSFALGAAVLREQEEVATGRLIVLHDPSGQEAWAGTWRLVSYVTAELEPEMGSDSLLAAVGWSWLLDALALAGARYSALGGTVTQVSSTRFGNLAGPPTSSDIEVRASWTPELSEQPNLGPHLDAWCGLLASTAGLPPPGIAVLSVGVPKRVG